MLPPTFRYSLSLLAVLAISVSTTADAQGDPATETSTADAAQPASPEAPPTATSDPATAAPVVGAAPEEQRAGWLRKQHDKEKDRVDYDKSHTPVLGLSGPRFGAYYVHADAQGRAAMDAVGLDMPLFLFLGYQFEWAWLATSKGTAGLIEVVPVISGFSHGLLLPSANVLVGLRGGNGLGLAMGAQAGLGTDIVPGVCGTNLCPPQLETRPFVAAVAVVGFAIPAGELIIPVDLVLSFDRQSTRIGLATGFSGFL